MKRMVCKLVCVFALLPGLLCFLPGAARAASPTKEDIQQKYRSLTLTTEYYAQEPSAAAPYSPGELTEEYLQSGLDYLNYARYLSGLSPVQLSQAFNAEAQQAALVCAANGVISHEPEQPQGMADSLYTAGYTGASTSNLAMGLDSLSDAIQACLDDFGPHNRAAVGHRRWFLSPYLTTIGLGYVDGFTAAKVVGGSSYGLSVDYDTISWPCAGNFPSNMLSVSAPWSITLNPEKYQVPSRETLTVTVTRQLDGRTWTYDAGTPEPENTDGAYLTVSQQRIGVPLCIIFYPGAWDVTAFEGVYTVAVAGLTHRDGSQAVLQYEIDFFDVTAYLCHSYDSGTVLREATAWECGAIRYTCTFCGDSYEESTLLRLAGENRFETAFQIADALKEQLGKEQFDAVLVASGLDFPDALSGSFLAARKQAPILLSGTGEYEEQVRAYLRANLAPGGTVYLLGGERVIPASFTDGLEEFTICRLAGANRYETNLAILTEAGTGAQPILVATGRQFADSLSASAVQLPILLVDDVLTPAQLEFLGSLTEASFCILGGENAVSLDMEKALSAFGAVTRIAGENRFETSALIAEAFFPAPSTAVVACGSSFPDGLCGGSLAAAMDAPLLLTMDRSSSPAEAYTAGKALSAGTALGGSGLVSDDLMRSLFQP